MTKRLISAIASQSITVCKLNKLLSRVTRHTTSFSDHYPYITYLQICSLITELPQQRSFKFQEGPENAPSSSLYTIIWAQSPFICTAQGLPLPRAKRIYSVLQRPESCRLSPSTDPADSLPITQTENEQRSHQPTLHLLYPWHTNTW